MQIYICVICKVNSPPLFVLSYAHRRMFEAVVSPYVNVARLKQCRLLTCGDCQRLLQTVLMFQETALIGVRHLLRLLPLVLSKRKAETVPDPLEAVIKQEPGEDSQHDVKSVMEIEIGPEKIQTQPVFKADKIKTEPDNDSSATASCESDMDIEDSVQTHTVKIEVAPVQTEAGLPGSKQAVKVDKVPRLLTTTLHRYESRSATFTPQPPPPRGRGRGAAATRRGGGRGGAATKRGAGRGGRKTNNTARATLPKKTTKAVKLIQSLPKQPRPSTSTVREESSDSDTSQTRKPSLPPSPWYTRILTDEQVASERAARRASAEYAASAHRCEPCVAAFASAADLAAHAGRHLATAGPYSCDICTLRARSEKELSEHRSQHTVRYCCCYCPHSAPDRQTATQHSCDVKKQQWQKTTFSKHLDGLRRRYTRPPRPVDCARCGAGFSGPAALAAHTLRYHTESEVPAECKVCNKVYKNEFLLKSHSYTHKKKGLESLRPELFCAECKIAFPTLSTFRNHQLTLRHTTHDQWKFECDYCGKKCPSKAGVRTHILMVHTEVREFKCDRCPKTFVSLNRLQRHGAAHDPSLRRRRHVCDQCGKAFVTKKTLSEHLNMHAGIRPHACPLCPATFTFKAALYTHNQLKHLKIKRRDKKGKKETGDAREMQDQEKLIQPENPVDH